MNSDDRIRSTATAGITLASAAGGGPVIGSVSGGSVQVNRAVTGVTSPASGPASSDNGTSTPPSTMIINRVITAPHHLGAGGPASSHRATSLVPENLSTTPQILVPDDDVELDDEDDLEEDSYDEEMLSVGEDVTSQLAAAGWQNGPVGVAAAAAIQSARRKPRRNHHQFETNPSVRKRQTTRLTRKLKSLIDEFSLRVGQQAIVLIATPGKNVNNYKVFGAKPLEDVVQNLKSVIMSELETALSQQAPNPGPEDPTLHELPPVCVDGIPTPVEKMTQAQLRAFIPLMLKYSTGRGKPGWGKESTRPPWWPKHVPWANVRMDARNEDQKGKSASWTHALRDIVNNCYNYHGRQDLLPKFTEEDETVTKLSNKKLNSWSGVVQTIANPDGTVSIVHVDPNNPVITLPDGTQAQIQIHENTGVHTLAEVATNNDGSNGAGGGGHEVQEHQHFLITGEDGNAYPVQVSGHQLVTVPASSGGGGGGMYQTVVAANIHSSDTGQVQVIGHPIQLGGVSGPVILKQEPLDTKSISVDADSVSSSQISVLHLNNKEQRRVVAESGASGVAASASGTSAPSPSDPVS